MPEHRDIAYPLHFEPILKPKVWGGRSLAQLGKPLPKDEMIGESWELADEPAGPGSECSRIANGPWAGRTLRDVLEAHETLIMGDVALDPHGRFPLLIKYLDARENLSVQVHPDEAYAAAHPEAHLKSEAWVVVHAEPGAVIYKGLRPEVDATHLRRSIERGCVEQDLQAIPVREGDCHYLPSGLCHALGAGVVVAEIQTPSDTTFRIYDWGRTDRELHIDPAIECLSFDGGSDHVREPGSVIERHGLLTQTLVRCPHFQIDRLEAKAAMELPIETSNRPMIWMVLQDAAVIEPAAGPSVELPRGRTTLLPAALSDARASLRAGAVLLQVKPPSPTWGMLA